MIEIMRAAYIVRRVRRKTVERRPRKTETDS